MPCRSATHAFAAVFSFIVFLSFPVLAETVQEKESLEDDLSGRFRANGLNYVIWQETEDDEESLEAQYSFSYRFFDCEKGRKNIPGQEESSSVCKEGAFSRFYFDFSFTGEFDFYLGTRDSGPVINRLSNPAFHLIWDYSSESNGIGKYLDIGIEHRSNGQVTDPKEPFREPFVYRTQFEYERENTEFFDTISQEANYLSLKVGERSEKKSHWSLKYKLYIDNESTVTWGEQADKNINIKDYDVLTAHFSKPFWNDKVTFTVDYTIGKETFDTDSVDVGLYIPLEFGSNSWRFPLYIRAHVGPMEKLSNYSQSVRSIGIGAVFKID